MAAPDLQIYKQRDQVSEYCFNIESQRDLNEQEFERLRLVLADGFLLDSVSLTPFLSGQRVVEVGPRMNFATAWSSNMVSICQASGLEIVTRI